MAAVAQGAVGRLGRRLAEGVRGLGRTAAEGIDWSAFKGNLYGQKRVGKAQQDLFFYEDSWVGRWNSRGWVLI